MPRPATRAEAVWQAFCALDARLPGGRSAAVESNLVAQFLREHLPADHPAYLAPAEPGSGLLTWLTWEDLTPAKQQQLLLGWSLAWCRRQRFYFWPDGRLAGYGPNPDAAEAAGD
jgi:hypothetical protein